MAITTPSSPPRKAGKASTLAPSRWFRPGDRRPGHGGAICSSMPMGGSKDRCRAGVSRANTGGRGRGDRRRAVPGEDLRRCRCGGVGSRPAMWRRDFSVGPAGFGRGFDPELFDRIAEAREAGQGAHGLRPTSDWPVECCGRSRRFSFINRYDPPRRLLIVGAVQIAQALAGLARELGIADGVIDPRARFLTEERFPGVTSTTIGPTRRWRIQARPSPAVVTLSHDTKIDPALIAALAAPTGYVGAADRAAATPRGANDWRRPASEGQTSTASMRPRASTSARSARPKSRCRSPPRWSRISMIAPENAALVLLAAGKSAQFGLSDKLTEPFLGQPLGMHVVTRWRPCRSPSASS